MFIFGNPVSMFIRAVVYTLKPIIFFLAGCLVGKFFL